MLKFKFIIIAGLVALMSFACGPERVKSSKKENQVIVQSEENFNQRYSVEIEWLQGPFLDMTKTNELMLAFTDKQGQPVKVDELEFMIWMKVHGHGGRDSDQSIRRIGDEGNAFVVKEFYFTMPGPWELNLSVTIDGISYRVEVPQTVEG